MENCKHSFIRNPVTGLFKCCKCQLVVDGKHLNEWRG